MSTFATLAQLNWQDIATAAVTLFFIMDPLGNVAVFNAVLAKYSSGRQALIVARELVLALLILFGFLFAGNAILGFLGISQSSLSIAGGVLLLMSSSEPDRMLEWSAALSIAWAGTTALLVVSPFLMRILGERGSRALERLMGMILFILATQLLMNGIREFVATL